MHTTDTQWFFLNFIYLFVFGLYRFKRAFSCHGKWALLSSCGARASLRGGFSCWGARALGHAGFARCSFGALEHRFSSCGTWAYLLHGMWDLPRSGFEPVSPAFTGGFFTIEPPGKPWDSVIFKNWVNEFEGFQPHQKWPCTPVNG